MKMSHALPSLVDAIGNTPLVRLDRLVRGRGLDGAILAKLEYLNPGFSKKDRAARGLIEQAERDGLLRPGQTVVELTSGNMGAGLAIVCAIRGYPFVAVMSKGNSPERARMMAALGAEVVLVDQLPDSVAGRSLGRRSGDGGGGGPALDHRARRLPRRPVPSRGGMGGALSRHRPGDLGRRAAGWSMPSLILPAPAAPMPA